MNMILKVTPEALKRQAEEISAESREMQKLLAEAESALRTLSGEWQGEAAALHMQQAAADVSACRTALSALQQHPQKLLVMAGLYAQAERSAAEEAEMLNSALLG